MRKKIKERLLRIWRGWVLPTLVIGFVVMSFRSSVADWNDVPSGSMEPTILVDDRILVNRLAYDLKIPFTTWHLAEWGAPDRGDIVVFFSPVDGRRWVKRVIGLPGDRVELRQGRLYVNGAPSVYAALDEETIEGMNSEQQAGHLFATESLLRADGGEIAHSIMDSRNFSRFTNFGPVTVPQDQFFVMGDHRNNSFDSRRMGTIDRKRILGQAVSIAFSLDRDSCNVPRWGRFFEDLD
jgi:signal peptidase I